MRCRFGYRHLQAGADRENPNANTRAVLLHPLRFTFLHHARMSGALYFLCMWPQNDFGAMPWRERVRRGKLTWRAE